MKPSATIKIILILFLIFGMGCEKVVLSPEFTIGTASDFRMNLPYTTTDGKYILKITEVNDSRCPEGAECVWAGEVYLKGKWIENNDTTDFELHSVLIDQQKQPEGFTIQIQDAKPYPKLNTESKPEDLAITLLIDKK